MMPQDFKNNSYHLIKIFILSTLVVVVLFAWQGNKGLNLWDEGYLWYGAQRVMLGEVPIRDFMAYDLGRYYWSAAIMSVLGDGGVINLRAAGALFQLLGLFVGVALLARSAKSKSQGEYLFRMVAAATLAIWMYPSFKVFDFSSSIFLIGALTYLVRNPIPKRYFVAGFFLGLIAVFGRNHGVYGAAATVGVMVWLSINRFSAQSFFKEFLYWIIGVTAGFSPTFLLMIAEPGFATAFWESIRFLFEIKATNLSLPVPWPWKVAFAGSPLGSAIRELLTGFLFVGVLLFGPLGIFWVVRQKAKNRQVSPVFVACAFLALPYAHYAFSRADIVHLAFSMLPMLIGCFVLISLQKPAVKWVFAVALCGTSIWFMGVLHPGWKCRAGSGCVPIVVSDSVLQVSKREAKTAALLNRLAAEYAPNGQSFVATPFWPGAYALLERRSPMWEIYALFPRSDAFQLKEIERIKASEPGFAIIFDWPLDGKDDLRFRNTHPLIDSYIRTYLEQVQHSDAKVYEIFKAAGADK